MSVATESTYNAISRAIEGKVEIYFNGATHEPLVAMRDDYLISFDVLEEASADSDLPFGSISANELSFELYNSNGMFTPTKTDGPYYGRIRSGVLVKPYIRPIVDDASQAFEWEPLGAFYVVDWKTEITGSVASVTATDRMQLIFDKPDCKLNVIKDATFAGTFAALFSAMSENATIDQALVDIIPYAYTLGSNKDTLNTLVEASQSFLYCDRDGSPIVTYVRGPQSTAHSLSDNNQVKSIKSTQSVVYQYNGVEVIANYHKESVGSVASLSLDWLSSQASSYVSNNIEFSTTPVYKMIGARVNGTADVEVTHVAASSTDIKYWATNKSAAETNLDASVDFIGMYLEIVKMVFSDNASSMLKLDNAFVQTNEYATKVKTLLEAYVSSATPILELEVRGNPKYKIGEKLHVVSNLYNVDFYGVLIRQTFRYDGALSSSLTLINSAILEVV